MQLQVHNENPARCGRNTDALVNLNTKLKLGVAQLPVGYLLKFVNIVFIALVFVLLVLIEIQQNWVKHIVIAIMEDAVHDYSLFYIVRRGRVDDLSRFDYLSPFCFLLIEFHCSFSISYKILPDCLLLLYFD